MPSGEIIVFDFGTFHFGTVYFSALSFAIHRVTDRKFMSFSITPVGDTPYRVSYNFASSANFNNWTFNSFE